MQSRLKLTLLRTTTCLVLFALVFFPLSGTHAASPAQEPGPGVSFAAGDHLITNIILGMDSPNILKVNQDVTLTFSYNTTEANGVRIYARPFTNGSLTPSYAGHPSELYPASATGKGSGFFTITTGEVVVDEIRLQMWNGDQTTLLFETFLPVYYLFSNSPYIVTNIGLTPDTPDVLKFNQNVDLTFDYTTTRLQLGVRIFARPFTNGALTPHYGAHPSGAYSSVSGSGTGWFTILSTQVVVDQIRIQMTNADQSLLLFEAFLPVYYRFRDPTHIVTNIELRPDAPNVFQYDQDVNLAFNYTTQRTGGVRIFARPFSGANLTPHYAAHGSPVYQASSGTATGSFSLTAGPAVVDKIRIQMWDANQTALLFETFLPVHLLWAGAAPEPGPDMVIDSIEVTQAIQDLNNSVDLVAGKRTYVRVHTHSPVAVADVYASLTGRRGWYFLAPTLSPGNPGSDITVRVSPDRGQINDSFWFELPSSWTNAGSLTLTARLDPNNVKNDLDRTDNVRSVTVNFLPTPPLRLRLMNVQYTSGGSTYLESSNHLDSLESWLRRAYPISQLLVTRQTFVYPTNGLPNVDTLNSYLAFAKLIRIIFSGEDGRVVYYGVVDDGGGFMRGKAAGIPGSVASGPSGSDSWGWDYDGSYNDWYGGHEIGHTRNRYHAEFCGAGGGTAYPYANGRISPALTGDTAIYGFDIETRAIYSPNWKDVMTYCSNQWISDFTYEGIRDYLVGQGGAAAASEPEMMAASSFLAIGGMADLDSYTATLDNVYLISQDNILPAPDPGDWTIALVDGKNNDLASYPFAPDELTDHEGSSRLAIIAEVVPWTDGTVRVEIRYQGSVAASRAASGNAPGVTLDAPAGGKLDNGPFQVSWTGSDVDGDALKYSLLYSRDGGSNWQTLATDLTTTSLELNTDQLPGGVGLLRVVVSDGFFSAYATSDPIAMPLHAPTAQVVLPTPEQVFFASQPVTLQGSGYDLEDETLGDDAFAWTSSIDGSLGTGATLNTAELSTGTHVITLQVTDSNGMSAQAQTTIQVVAEDTVETANLQVSSTGFGVLAIFGDLPTQHSLSVRSSGDIEVDWQASEDVSWLTLDTSAGTTPTDLALTVDPKGLPLGVYTGKIAFSSTQAGNSPLDIEVTLQVIGYGTYLPVALTAP